MSDRLSDPVFLDTAYAVALVNRDDLLHGVAVELADRLKRDNPKLITTRAILLEIGDSLSKPQHRQVAGELLTSIDEDPSVEVVEVTVPLYVAALQLYRERLDKGWGMTDCLSFVLMRSRGSTESLTHDGHFEQAGFRALMR
jgi:predicted nucleic acid-binding protein